MEIDSGLGSYQYSGRLHVLDRDMDKKKAPENAEKPRVATNPVVSSTLLSPSLSDALWDIEGRAEPDAARSFSEETSLVQWVQGAYLEHS